MPDLLRETFEEYALRAPSAAGLREAVDARVRRARGRRRWAAVAGAAATAAAVVAAVAVVDTGRPPRPSPLVTEPAAPPGTRLVLWRGLELALPEAWFADSFDACGAPRMDAVVVNQAPTEGDCALTPRPGVTTAFLAVPGDPRVEDLGAGRETLVDGHPARHLVGTTYGSAHAEAVVLPDRDAAVLVTTDDPAVARRVLDGIRVRRGPTDARGCVIRPDSTYPTSPPARPGADDVMVPGSPVQVSVCRYDEDVVIVSALGGADVAGRLAATFNALEPGFSPATERGGRQAFLVTFRYAEGPDVVVHLRRDGRANVGATNGAVTGRLSDALGDALRPIAGWEFTYDQYNRVRVTPTPP